jgi:hypothetical protein
MRSYSLVQRWAPDAAGRRFAERAGFDFIVISIACFPDHQGVAMR